MSSSNPANVDSRLSSLETKVEGIVGTVQSMVNAIQGLGDKFDRRGQTPWGVIYSAIGVAVSVMTVVGGLAYWPIQSAQTDFKAALIQMQDRSDKRFEQLAAGVVPRAEHSEHWRRDERDIEHLSRRIEKLEDARVKP